MIIKFSYIKGSRHLGGGWNDEMQLTHRLQTRGPQPKHKAMPLQGKAMLKASLLSPKVHTTIS